MQSESSTKDIQERPDWEKVEKPAPAPLGPQDGWGDSLATYGPFPPTSPGYNGASVKEVEHASKSWTACYDDGCFVHLSEKQGRWFPKEPKKHTTKRNLPYATQLSPSPPPPLQTPKPKYGNSREVHAKKISWDKCNRKGCKTHKEEKSRNGTMRTRLGGEVDKEPQEKRWDSGEETEVDDEGTLQWADMLQQRHIMRETIRLQDEMIRKQQETIEQQRVAIEVGTTTIAMLKRQWQAEEGINKRLRKDLKRTGRFLSEVGR